MVKAVGGAVTRTAPAGCFGSNGDDDEASGDDATDEDVDGYEIDPGTTILFEGKTSGWVGIEPEAIADEQNPTLILQAGEEYEIGWSEGDGTRHNIEIRDEDGDVVEEYETDLTDDPGDDQLLSITATEEMAVYRCRPHGSMEGEIRVE